MKNVGYVTFPADVTAMRRGDSWQTATSPATTPFTPGGDETGNRIKINRKTGWQILVVSCINCNNNDQVSLVVPIASLPPHLTHLEVTLMSKFPRCHYPFSQTFWNFVWLEICLILWCTLSINNVCRIIVFTQIDGFRRTRLHHDLWQSRYVNLAPSRRG